jgi:hypothetical protein
MLKLIKCTVMYHTHKGTNALLASITETVLFSVVPEGQGGWQAQKRPAVDKKIKAAQCMIMPVMKARKRHGAGH